MEIIHKHYRHYCKHVEKNNIQSIISTIDTLALSNRLNNKMTRISNYNSSLINYPLGMAIYKCAHNIVEYLLEKGANTNLKFKPEMNGYGKICVRNHCFVTFAIHRLRDFILMITYGPSLAKFKRMKDEKYQEKMHCIIESLIKYGAKINMGNDHELYILHDAIAMNDLSLVKILIKYGIDVNVILHKYELGLPQNITILDYISRNRQIDFTPILKLLIMNGINLEISANMCNIRLWNCLASILKPILIFYTKFPDVLSDVIFNYLFS